MALPKKKSRPITVGSNKYRYIVSTSRIDNDSNFKLNLTVQIAEGEGAILKVIGLLTRDFWLDFSDKNDTNDKKDYPVILPNHIAKMINKATKNGWLPLEKGTPFILNLSNNFILE